MHTDRATIGTAIGRIPSGCSILTVEHAGRATGVLVSWVQQASFDPPCLTVCLKHGRPAGALVDQSRRFVLSLVGEDPTAIFKHFAKGFSLEEDAFAGLAVTAGEFGPMIDDCIAHIGCEVREKVEAGDHDVYIAEVKAAAAQPGAAPYVHLRKSGFNY